LTGFKSVSTCVDITELTSGDNQMSQYKYCVKEYMGDRPCIEPATMAFLRLRCHYNQTKPRKKTWLEKLIQIFNNTSLERE
jgi:hypothetical protein